MQSQPYLFFAGRCEEALRFYAKALGARIEMLMRYRESPEPPLPGILPARSENGVMRASFAGITSLHLPPFQRPRVGTCGAELCRALGGW